jgi:elongator complex protein 5
MNCLPLCKPGQVSNTISPYVLHSIFVDPSRLILHGFQTCKLVQLLMQPAFSPSLRCLLARPAVLITHLAREYLTPPPPASSDAKFWSVFLPVSERANESERLVFGSGGEGSGSTTEFVVEILVRGFQGSDKKRGVERMLEGWSLSEGGACNLTKLESLKTLWRKNETMADSEVTLRGLGSYRTQYSLFFLPASDCSRSCSRCVF